MGWFGKVVGGGIGALVGGPAGAAVGFGLGSAFDSAAADGAAEEFDEGVLAGSTAMADEDDAGLGIIIQTATALPESYICGIYFHGSDEQPLMADPNARARCANASGQIAVPGVIADKLISAYLPAGALGRGRPGKIFGIVRIGAKAPDGSTILVGVKPFRMDAPAPQPWSLVELYKPLIALFMRVAHADGTLVAEEVRQIRDYLESLFDGDPHDASELRDAMKARALHLSDEELAAAAHRRLPTLEWQDVMGLLAGVARCDGQVSPKELEVIRSLAIGYYGCTEADWTEVRAALELKVEDHWTVLGLSPGASASEIKKAYRGKMLDYHPDRVANLAPDFQELAHQKTIEIRAAYDALLIRIG